MSAEDSNFKSRKKQFKKTLDADDVRRKREDEEVLMRKADRAELLAKKRQYTGGAAGSNFNGDDGGMGGAGNFTPSSSSSSRPVITTANGLQVDINGNVLNSMENAATLGRLPLGMDKETQLILQQVTTINPKLLQECMSDEEAIPKLGEILLSNTASEEEIHAAVFGLRKRLSKETKPPIEAVIKAGLCNRLVHLMMNSSHHKTKFECAWALTNVGSGNSQQTMAVVNAGGIDAFTGILLSTAALKHDLCEQCVWALGNIAGDGAALRDQLLHNNLMTILQNICSAITELNWTEQQKTTLMRNTIWVMSNLCRGKPPPKIHLVAPAFECFAEVIGRQLDKDMTCDALWGMSYLVGGGANDGDEEDRCRTLVLCGQADRTRLVVQPNKLCEFIINFISLDNVPEIIAANHSGEKINPTMFRSPALRIVGNMVSAAEHEIAEILLLSGLHPPLLDIVRWSNRENLRKEAAWTLSNIAAGTASQVRRLAETCASVEIEIPIENGEAAELKQLPLDTFDILSACVLGEKHYTKARYGVDIVAPIKQTQVKKECAYALLNAANTNLRDVPDFGNALMNKLVTEKQLLEVMLEVFNYEEARMCQDGLMALNCVFSWCQLEMEKKNSEGFGPMIHENPFVVRAEEIGIKDKLNELAHKFFCNTNVNKLSENCIRFLEKWFVDEDAEDDDWDGYAENFGVEVPGEFNFGPM